MFSLRANFLNLHQRRSVSAKSTMGQVLPHGPADSVSLSSGVNLAFLAQVGQLELDASRHRDDPQASREFASRSVADDESLVARGELAARPGLGDGSDPPAWQVSIPSIKTPLGYAVPKRGLDLVGALLGLVLLSPVMAVCAILIKVFDGGPVLFWQTRVGERGKQFEIVKFRSMVVNAEELKFDLAVFNQHADDRTFKIFHDPRITTIGRVMRRLSLDELPQFWNLLCGQMSLVGPRPALAEEVAKYQDADRVRLSVRPGLTCIWQVSGRSQLDFRRQREVDREYLERRGLGVDLKLILRTIPAVVRGDGAA